MPRGLTESELDRFTDRIPFFGALSPDDRRSLAPAVRCRTVRRGERLWSEGDPTAEFLFLVRGTVKQIKHSEVGREAILQVWGPGQLLCTSAYCSTSVHCCTTIALQDDVEIVAVGRRAMLALLESSPSASHAFVRELAGREAHLGRRIEELSGGLVERRVAMLLFRFAEQMGVCHGEDATSIPIPLTRQDLADLCGTTLETAIRTMSRLDKQGVVKSYKDGFLVTDRQRLEQLVRGERR